MEITFKELLKAIDGSIIVDNENKAFNRFCIDSRNVEQNNIFVAIKGERFNANEAVIDVLNKGASIVIVDEVLFDKKEALGKGIVIKVENSVKALLKLANYYRRKLGIKVVGVTGSTGKTSTKDLIAALLSHKYKVFKTKGNFNSEIGLPLMIFELTSQYDIAVLEMGMSDLGEISRLAETALPDIGVITNIGLSHLERLKTQDNILKAKMEITDYFKHNNLLILNGEDVRLTNISSNSFKVEKIGYNHEYDVYATNIILREDSVEFVANVKEEKHLFKLPMAGKHNVLNCMLGILVAKELGLSLAEMEKGISNLEATSMRLQVIKNNGITIINDCYNASPDSMKSSLDVISTYTEGRKVAVLGDMYELGDKSKEAHKEVGSYAKDKLQMLIAIGENAEEYKSGYDKNEVITFKTKEECIENLDALINKGDVILVKASRGMKFEGIVKKLEELNKTKEVNCN